MATLCTYEHANFNACMHPCIRACVFVCMHACMPLFAHALFVSILDDAVPHHISILERATGCGERQVLLCVHASM